MLLTPLVVYCKGSFTSGVCSMFTQEEVKRLFDYDPMTGFCTRLTRPARNVRIGQGLGWIQNCAGGLNYLKTEIDYKQYLVHRLIWLWMTGQMPEKDIDHIDGNGLNNVWSNLREATRSQNMRNAKIRTDNKSGQAGVSFHARSRKWRASINTGVGTKKHLGYYDNLQDAIVARLQAEKTNGYHKNHGRAV